MVILLKIFRFLEQFFRNRSNAIQKELDDRKAYQLKLANEKAKQKYWIEYWYFALILWEVIGANLELLKVLFPDEPRDLKSPTFAPKNADVFEYVLKRKRENTPQSDSAVLKSEIHRYLVNDLLACGFSSFEVSCEEDTYNYSITVRKLNGFVFGRVMSSSIGKLVPSRFYNQASNQYINVFDINYFGRGFHGSLKDNTNLLIYFEGQWIPTRVLRDSNNNPYLSRLPNNYHAGFDYLVKI